MSDKENYKADLAEQAGKSNDDPTVSALQRVEIQLSQISGDMAQLSRDVQALLKVFQERGTSEASEEHRRQQIQIAEPNPTDRRPSQAAAPHNKIIAIMFVFLVTVIVVLIASVVYLWRVSRYASI